MNRRIVLLLAFVTLGLANPVTGAEEPREIKQQDQNDSTAIIGVTHFVTCSER